jgi:sugar lactone lactonase YvrE
VAVDSSGSFFVADTLNHTIRKVTPSGVVSTFAGQANEAGDSDGTGSDARFHLPVGVAIDASDNLFVADFYKFTIRKITPSGVVATFAGKPGQSGPLTPGDTGDGTEEAVRFDSPTGIAIDGAGNLFVVDTFNSTIRKITPSGVVSTYAGKAHQFGYADGASSDARFFNPIGVAVDRMGKLFVSDLGNYTIRKITPNGIVSTLAGEVGQPGANNGVEAAAHFLTPRGLAVDGRASSMWLMRAITGSARWTRALVGSPPWSGAPECFASQKALCRPAWPSPPPSR